MRGLHEFKVRTKLSDVEEIPQMLTVDDVLPEEYMPRAAPIPVIEDPVQIPTKPYDQLLWRAYVHGAAWGEGAFEQAEYPEWNDRLYYEGSGHGQIMLKDFYSFIEEMKPKPIVMDTTCELGRPYRHHQARCHPLCNWSPS